MGNLVRFGVSMEETLLNKFDRLIKSKKYSTRSKAIIDLISESLIAEDWSSGKETAGTISIVYDHHKNNLGHKITHIQHHHHKNIISSQHVHLDENNCLEIIIVKGKPSNIKMLADELKSVKGIKHCSLGLATTGKTI